MNDGDILVRGQSDEAETSFGDTAKRRQILAGARRVFLADGFDGASMNEVARTAGVSKGTLYVYFADKEDLFAALIREEKREQAEQLCQFDSDDPDLRATLIGFGVKLLELMLRPESIAHIRTVIAVAGKFPAIGRAFYEAGPCFGRRRLAAFFTRQHDEGRINAPDPDVAAEHFLGLCKSRIYMGAALGAEPTPEAGAIRCHIECAVDVFLRAYGAL